LPGREEIPKKTVESFGKAADAEAHFNRGNMFSAREQFEPALASYDAAIGFRADHPEAHCNRGLALCELKQWTAALAGFDRAIAIKADFADAHFNEACLKLLRGDLEGGWIDYEWRHRREGPAAAKNQRPLNSQPLWLGQESLSGKTILLHSEQGLGDTIQFCRYSKLVAALGARVILAVPQPLIRLLASLEGVSQVIAQDSEPPNFDYQCPLMSLPLAFKTSLHAIPQPTQYLTAARSS